MRSRAPVASPGPAPELPVSVCADRRRQLLDRIGDSVAVIPSGPKLTKSRETEITFRQSSDLFYLTAFPEPDAVAVISPHGKNELTLFVREREPEQEAWSGPRIGVERAAEDFGAGAVYPIVELEERLPDLLKPACSVHYPIGSLDLLEDLIVESVRSARRARPRSGVGPTSLVDLDLVTGEMRLVKDTHELERMRVAASIGAAGHVAAMERIRPGAGEWEIQAALESKFRELGAASPAFPSIVGSGSNATILHYVANQSRVRDGDLVLIDAGVEWGMYCSDITRTVPASGRFTPEQRDVYDVVLAAEAAAIAAAMPGSPFSDIHDAAVRVLVQGLLDLGILPEGDADGLIEAGAYRRFYLHQTSHWLGLDVHDAGPYKRNGESVTLEAGMVMTIEPGLYIPLDSTDVPEALRGVGVRIEDDIVITEVGNEVLTRDAPVDPEAIETLMRDG